MSTQQKAGLCLTAAAQRVLLPSGSGDLTAHKAKQMIQLLSVLTECHSALKRLKSVVFHAKNNMQSHVKVAYTTAKHTYKSQKKKS